MGGGYSDWDGSEYASQFGKAASFYPPKTTTIDRHPDKRPSSSAHDILAAGPGYVEIFEARQQGAVYVSLTSDPATGRLVPVGLSCFSSDMLQFGLTAEPGAPKD